MTTLTTKAKPAVGARSLRQAAAAKTTRRRAGLQDMAVGAFDVPTRRNDLTPELVMVQRSPAALQIPARNVRRLDAAHVREVAVSITSLGFCDPPIIDAENRVLDGAVRVEAAKLAGLASIPCLVAGHLNPKERRLLRLALNRLQEKGAWVIEDLKLELEELIVDDMPIEIIGFSGPELDVILMGDEAPAVEPGPVTPVPGATPVAQRGDIFALGEHRVICGDATDPEILKLLMGAESARLILTDEPYNVPVAGHVTGGDHREFAMASGEMSEAEFRAFNARWIAAALPYLCDGGVLSSFIDWRGYPTLHAAALDQGLTALNLVVWGKTNAGMGSLYRSQHELLPLFKKGQGAHVNNVALGRNGRWRSNLWTYPGASSLGSDARRGLQDHPTVKPVAMLEDAILDLTARGAVVLDPFLGSGSTLMAAEKAGRRCYGVEIDPVYVDLIVRRYEEVTGRSSLLLRAGSDHELGANVHSESVTAPNT